MSASSVPPKPTGFQASWKRSVTTRAVQRTLTERPDRYLSRPAAALHRTAALQAPVRGPARTAPPAQRIAPPAAVVAGDAGHRQDATSVLRRQLVSVMRRGRR